MNSKSSSFERPDFSDYLRRQAASFPMLVELVAAALAFADPKTPVWAKATIGAAIAYVLCPLDAIPDFIPVAGWVDDLSVLGAALTGAAGVCITEEHRRRAREMLGGNGG